uniref:Integrase, catalytic region, zinc finger, CCHC-type, peptidase aspartic, catalytic n=1 Tax=Tanacetum cinerariifolium TaxID=118510 RepID=A0A6L2JX23_TANCI|nr:integrase, catalytic region, zinc finger, CCHC-type, peptidase aspartic, catalytic [Tanacetum cinerariifolium]
MTTLGEFMIIVGEENRPPMLEKSLYESWKSLKELYIENREKKRMILNLVQNAPFIWPTFVEEDDTTRTKRYEELSVAERLQASCDLKATNIVLQGLPPDVYANVNHHKVAKEIWDRVKLLIQGTKLSLQEKECLAVLMFNQGDDPISFFNKTMALLTVVDASRFPSTNNQLRTFSNSRNQATIQDNMVTKQQVQGRQRQSEGHMARQCTQPKRPRNIAWFKEKATLVEAHKSEKANQEKNNESLTAELERYKERDKTFEQRLNIDLSAHEKMIDSQMSDMIKEKLVLKQQIDSLEQNLSNQIKEKEYLLQRFTVFKHESKEKESKYIDKEIGLEKKIRELDNIVYKVGQSAQIVHMLTKLQVFYDDTHKQALDFGKRFVPQQELSDEQAFWLQTSDPNTNQSASSPVKTKAPKELPKDVLLSVMNSTTLSGESVNLGMQKSESCDKCFDLDAELLKSKNAYNALPKSYPQLEKHCISLELTMQLKQEIFQKDSFSDNQNVLEILKYFKSNDLKAQLQAKDTTICKLKEHIKSRRENNKEEKVKHEMDEAETINIELEHSVAKLLYENERLHKEIEHLKKIYKDQFDSIKKSCALSLKNTNLEGVDLLSRSRDINLYTISVDDMLKTSSIYLLSKASKTKSWLWHPRLSHLNFGTLNMLAKDSLARGIQKLEFKKDQLCSACVLGKNKKSSHQPKAKDTNQEKLYLLYMDLCGPMRVESINGKNEDLGKLNANADIGIFVGYAPAKKAFRIYNRRTQKIMETIHVTFDELTTMAFDQFSLGLGLQYMTPATSTPVAAAPRAVDIAGSPSSTTIDQDAHSSCTSSTNQQQQSLIISQGVEEPIPNTIFDDPCHEPLHDVSTSQKSSSNVQSSHSPLELIGRYTKDHPLANVIGNPSRPVSTRKQLKTDAMWCYFDAFLTSIKPKNFKEVMLESSWIEAIQEEIHEFKRLQV